MSPINVTFAIFQDGAPDTGAADFLRGGRPDPPAQQVKFVILFYRSL